MTTAMTEGFDRPLTQGERTALRARAAECPHRPTLAVVCLGVLPSWAGEDCAQCGIYCERYAIPLGMGAADLRELAEGLSLRGDLDGVLLWPDLPAGWDGQELSAAVSPAKRVSAPTWAGTLARAIARAEERE